MEAVDRWGMEILRFFPVSAQKMVPRELLDLFDGGAPGFWGEPF